MKKYGYMKNKASSLQEKFESKLLIEEMGDFYDDKKEIDNLQYSYADYTCNTYLQHCHSNKDASYEDL